MRTLIYFIFLLFISNIAFSQQSTQVTVSTDKINENGVIKYVHNVKQGQTLYSISKAYNVSSQVIIDNNPALKSGLKSGTMIFIPVESTTSTEEVTSKVEEIVTKEEEIAKPIVASATQTENKSVNTTASKKKYKKHTVKWYENLDDIAQKYEVSVEAIYSLNNLTTKQLSKRQQLFIPDNEYMDELSVGEALVKEEDIEEQITAQLENDSTQNELDTQFNRETTFEVESNNHLRERYDVDRVLNISMFLPINGEDTLNINKNFMEFYGGALLAIENLKQNGANIELTLNDYKNGSAADIIRFDQLPKIDLIIGPINRNQISDLLNITESFSIPVVSPMDMDTHRILPNHRELIQAPTLESAYLENLVSKLSQDIENSAIESNVLLCYEQWGKDTATVRETKELLKRHNISYKNLSYTILEGRGISKEMRLALADTITNYVIIPSNNEGFVNDAVRNLNLIYNSHENAATKENPCKFSLNLYGMPRWRAFSTIEPEVFHKMKLQLSIPYYIDYTNSQTKEFLLKYRAIYNAEPSPYAYQGYDTAKYFISLVQRFGKEFIFATELPKESMLQSSYNFKRANSEGGFSNNATRVIKYNSDYTIVVE